MSSTACDVSSTLVTKVVSVAVVSVSTRVAFVNDVISKAVSRRCDAVIISDSSEARKGKGDKKMKTVASLMRGIDDDIDNMCDDEGESNEFLKFSEGIDNDINTLIGVEGPNVENDWEADVEVDADSPVGGITLGTSPNLLSPTVTMP